MLKEMVKYNLKITLETGLHIGGGKDDYDIGGADSTVMKDPLTSRPIIPGSSLKGKIRTLLTWKYGVASGNSDIKGNEIIETVFGNTNNDDKVIGITRVVFRDAYLSDKSAETLSKRLGHKTYTEIKAENSIDKLKGTAKSKRFIERVPASAEFETEIILNIFENDDKTKMKQLLEEGFKLLELNYLGGSGSRGYGKVKIEYTESSL